MAHTLINGHKVPLTDFAFHYVKNGEFERENDLYEVVSVAHSKGDGSGQVYSVETYVKDTPEMRFEAQVARAVPVIKDYQFEGEALIRRLKELQGCLHENTETVMREDFPVHGQNFEVVSCKECPAVISREVYAVDVNDENQRKTTLSYVLGGKRDSAVYFSAVPNPVTYDDFILFEDVQVPLVYEKFAVATGDRSIKPYETAVTFDTFEKTKHYALAEGNGSLEYMVTRMYQYFSSAISYEVEVTEVKKVEGLVSYKVASRARNIEKKRTCEHLNVQMNDTILDGARWVGEIEFSEFVCTDCETTLNYKYFIDACQLEYSKKLAARTTEQQACAHEATILKPTPSSFLACLLLDASVSTYCAKCNAYLHTDCKAYEETLMDSKSLIVASFLW